MVRVFAVLVVATFVIGLVFLRPGGGEGKGRTFEVSVVGGEMIPRTVRAVAGERVTLGVASDGPVEVHVHGVGATAREGGGISFVAARAGRYGIEDHRSGRKLGALVVEPR